MSHVDSEGYFFKKEIFLEVFPDSFQIKPEFWIMSSFVVAMCDLSLRKADVEEKRAKVQKESKVLLEYTRKAIAKLNDLKK